MQRVRRTGVLRAGFEPNIIPFCYWNASGELVGYDVAFIYHLARDMNVRLELIPFHFSELSDSLKARKFDMAIGGIFVNQDRLLELSVSKPYMQAPIALIARSSMVSHLTSRERIASQRLHIACIDSPVLVPLASRLFPGQQITVVKDYETIIDDKRFDAALWKPVPGEGICLGPPWFYRHCARRHGQPPDDGLYDAAGI